ncbi:ThiJ/PfpI domain-containing protein [Colwellia psychrerythraea]|uniref:ThiJ/PfpI domain-containing protein n=2 Tax=Colwellia psychrerythraea TaxID=28229 RepID=A0A099L5T5_COLPS|nr:ThiJ/PfpI domain-containing protein [Colwellia psychrerythraea]
MELKECLSLCHLRVQWELASDSHTIKMIEDFYNAGKQIAMVCHAPAILRDAKKLNGESLVKGLTVTGFMNSEDDELDLSRHLLFSLKDMLKDNGASYLLLNKSNQILFQLLAIG